MKSYYVLLCVILLTGCVKENVAPIVLKADSPKKEKTYGDSDTSNPEYWYNGTKGTALVRVICKDCTAIASFGVDTVPFLFNDDGVGYLKYTPKVGLTVYIAVCPGGTKAIKADILDSKNIALFSYSGTGSSNWINTYLIN